MDRSLWGYQLSSSCRCEKLVYFQQVIFFKEIIVIIDKIWSNASNLICEVSWKRTTYRIHIADVQAAFLISADVELCLRISTSGEGYQCRDKICIAIGLCFGYHVMYYVCNCLVYNRIFQVQN